MVNIVHWKCRRNNWGDAIAEYIAEQISGQSVKWFHGEDIKTNELRYTCTGSINQWLRSDNTVIWGTGFISEISRLHIKPAGITAVRGPLTREKFIKFGYLNCPEVYGDPALLLPRFYNPNIKKKYKVGIIPHYVDAAHPWLNKFKDNPNIKIIDVTNRPEEMKNHRFINEVLQCEHILSSSLHGIIIGDAYGIPSTWIKFSDNVVGKGFKFRDYFMSVNRLDREPFIIQNNSMISQIIKSQKPYKINIDLNTLIEACPFKK